MKWIVYSMILLKIKKINIFIHLKKDVHTIFFLQKWKKMTKIFYQLHSDEWKINLNSMVYVENHKCKKELF